MPTLAYVSNKEFAVVAGTRIAARVIGDVGYLRIPPKWSNDGRYVAALQSSGIAVIDASTLTVREVLCECSSVAAIGRSGFVWVGSNRHVFTIDPASDTEPRMLSISLGDEEKPSIVLAGGKNEFLLSASRADDWSYGSPVDALFAVRLDGQAKLLRRLPAGSTDDTAESDGESSFIYTFSLIRGDCGHYTEVWLDNPSRSQSTATDTSALIDGYAGTVDVSIYEAWWAPDGSVYAIMRSSACTPTGRIDVVPVALWRLQDDRWVLVDRNPPAHMRQLTDGATALVIATDSIERIGDLYVEGPGMRIKIASEVHGISAAPSIAR